MNEKTPLRDAEAAQDVRQEDADVRSVHRLRWHVRATFGVLAILMCLLYALPVTMREPQFHTQHATNTASTSKKVPLEAHIMSKCPDAKVCLESLVVPTMQQVSGKVDFKLSYIGRVTEHDDGIECMHGQTECLGNILELCAASLYPDPKIYLGFTMCLTREFEDIPRKELVMDCALEHGLDFGKLNHCMSEDDGETGIKLLRDSVERSRNANVTKSCTVRLDNEIRCIRDGGQWKDCEGGSAVKDLIRDINNLYE